ncbi:hypothetical protein JCM8547_006934 [Rhodosporidiobolus lusitaniae]
MRFTIAFLAALPLLRLASAKPPSLVTDPLSDTYCEDYTQGDTTDVALCAPIFSLLGTLSFTGNSAGGNLEDTLTGITDLLGGNTGPLGGLLTPVLGGIVGGLAPSVGNALSGLVPGLLSNLNPKCKCDLANCYTSLTTGLQTARSSDDENAVINACTTAQYNCAPYYSTTEINEAIPECAEYFCDAASDPSCTSSGEGTDTSEESESSSEEKKRSLSTTQMKKRSAVDVRSLAPLAGSKKRMVRREKAQKKKRFAPWRMH